MLRPIAPTEHWSAECRNYRLSIKYYLVGHPEKACSWYIQGAHNGSSLEKKRKEVCVKLYGGPPE